MASYLTAQCSMNRELIQPVRRLTTRASQSNPAPPHRGSSPYQHTAKSVLGRLSVSGATVYRPPSHCHHPPCSTALSDPLFECTGHQNGLYGSRASPMNLLPQRANAGSEPKLIRFAEPTAVDTVLNKRSLLLLASNRCKPLRSASVRLQGPQGRVAVLWPASQ